MVGAEHDGPTQRSRESAPTKADCAAGTATSDLLRLAFSYRGSIMYKMQAGMGDTVFTPLYEVLKRRGVRFEFFHDVKRLGLAHDAAMVDTIVRPPPQSSYETDFHAWTQSQAASLRALGQTGTNAAIDWENVAEEIESLGRSQASALRSRLRTIIEHPMKLEFSPAQDPAISRQDTISRSRVEFEDDISDSPHHPSVPYARH